MTDQVAVNKVIMYSFNFEHNFLLSAFKGSIANHLQSKFLNLCEIKKDSQSAFMRLYTELDNENRKVLINYILDNYEG